LTRGKYLNGNRRQRFGAIHLRANANNIFTAAINQECYHFEVEDSNKLSDIVNKMRSGLSVEQWRQLWCGGFFVLLDF